MKIISAISRALTGIPYVILGYGAATAPGQRVDAAGAMLAPVRSAVPVPVNDEAIVRLNGAAQAVAGGMLTAGLYPRASAGVLLASLVPTTVAGHAYWNHEDPQMRAMQQVQFLKNVAMAGGLIAIAAKKK
ncbi:DoxX family protein [Gordonia alkaliphila]|uniref:DoxX family membrane protein n=1 Tax=Gordonia alkaliphila TaxID=1053547 RepID=A0ABP8ZC36_9ACTN|nr:DoxX family protein [Gordonia alkaliphila]MCK0439844.1 DoxX family protein [Gordonia alkaliphila]